MFVRNLTHNIFKCAVIVLRYTSPTCRIGVFVQWLQWPAWLDWKKTWDFSSHYSRQITICFRSSLPLSMNFLVGLSATVARKRRWFMLT